MTTADGNRPAFSGRHPKLFIISDLYREVAEIAEVHADIAQSFITLITSSTGMSYLSFSLLNSDTQKAFAQMLLL